MRCTGSVCSTHPRLNNVIGSVAVRLYALFSYRKLLEKHWAHHRTPASNTDPDFHDGQHTGFLAWYFHFMRELPELAADSRYGRLYFKLWNTF